MARRITIRPATAVDADALARLAALDSAPALTGHVLIAEVGGEPLAATTIATGATVADPFNPTTYLVERLQARAAELRPRRQRPRLRLRPRTAFSGA